MCARGDVWELFSTTLPVEVEVAILKYGSPLHFHKSSVGRRKGSPHARSLACLALPGQVRLRVCAAPV